jgi:Tol biopolymer transport system component
VTTGSRLWSSPDPSPDGQTVAFYSRVNPEGDLYLARSDGTGFRQVTSDPPLDRLPRWSPDGPWIAFFSDRSGKLQIWKVRPDGSELQQLSDTNTETAMAVWSPDGQRIAARGVAGHDASALIFDATRSFKSQTPDVLPPPEGTDPFSTNGWSRDGKFLAGQCGFKMGVYIYSLAERKYTKLTDIGEWPVWFPDNRNILFVHGGKDFFVVDRMTKNVRKVFSVKRDVIGPPRLSADGTQAFYSRRVTEGDIWLARLQ